MAAAHAKKLVIVRDRLLMLNFSRCINKKSADCSYLINSALPVTPALYFFRFSTAYANEGIKAGDSPLVGGMGYAPPFASISGITASVF